MNCSIQDFKGQIFSLCKDQQGCRFLQKRLDDGDDASLIFNEIYPHFIELMADPFGNYLCQKLLDFCSPQQKYVVVGAIAGALVGVCLNAHGTRAVQKLCEIVADTDLVYLMIDALRNNVVTLIKVNIIKDFQFLGGNSLCSGSQWKSRRAKVSPVLQAASQSIHLRRYNDGMCRSCNTPPWMLCDTEMY